MNEDQAARLVVLVTEALSIAERIKVAAPERYADYSDRYMNARRRYTLKDAKAHAAIVEAKMREAWQILDPI